jgi:putative transposase
VGADITYVPTWSDFLCLAVVLDVFSRRVVGGSMSTTLRTELVLAALDMALAVRRPGRAIHHSDQGSQDGLKLSSQDLDGGGCDEPSKATFGSVWTDAIVFPRSAASGRTR